MWPEAALSATVFLLRDLVQEHPIVQYEECYFSSLGVEAGGLRVRAQRKMAVKVRTNNNKTQTTKPHTTNLTAIMPVPVTC